MLRLLIGARDGSAISVTLLSSISASSMSLAQAIDIALWLRRARPLLSCPSGQHVGVNPAVDIGEIIDANPIVATIVICNMIRPGRRLLAHPSCPFTKGVSSAALRP